MSEPERCGCTAVWHVAVEQPICDDSACRFADAKAKADRLEKERNVAQETIDVFEDQVARLQADLVAERARVARLQDAISPSRKGMVHDDYYIAVVARMRRKEAQVAALAEPPSPKKEA